MTKLEAVVKKIQEAVPEIMELKFGCVVIYRPPGTDGGCRVRFTALSDHGDIGYFTPSVNGNSAERVDQLFILGRPIRLADVLVALDGEREAKVELVRDDKWDCIHDDLTMQNDELIEWLYEVLNCGV